MESKVMAMVFSMVSEIERDLTSFRTKEGSRGKDIAQKFRIKNGETDVKNGVPI
jgi:DNA invertase Pin-like site-specific DNA recombinase